jgi:hypothetical protein
MTSVISGAKIAHPFGIWLEEFDGLDGFEEFDGLDGLDGLEELDGLDGLEEFDGFEELDGLDGLDGLFVNLYLLNPRYAYTLLIACSTDLHAAQIAAD